MLLIEPNNCILDEKPVVSLRQVRMVEVREEPESLTSPRWLLTSIVHDLRNPLAAIRAGAEILSDPEVTVGVVNRLATNIHRAAECMQELLSEITRSLDGKRPVYSLCKMREVILGALEIVSATHDTRNVDVVLEVPAEMEVLLVRPHMERVFVNLISNAVEAMTQGGRLLLSASGTGYFAKIVVEDNGPGIPARIRDRLFRPFVTADKEGGLGLGLTLVRQIVQEHGGEIWTEPSAGARFVIQLPRTELFEVA